LLLDVLERLAASGVATSSRIPIVIIRLSIIPAYRQSLKQRRVVGTNGNGVGDNPAFTNLFLNCALVLNANPAWSLTSITTTQMTLKVTMPVPVSFGTTLSYAWFAIACLNGNTPENC
jgi:hypothetical protein